MKTTEDLEIDSLKTTFVPAYSLESLRVFSAMCTQCFEGCWTRIQRGRWIEPSVHHQGAYQLEGDSLRKT